MGTIRRYSFLVCPDYGHFYLEPDPSHANDYPYSHEDTHANQHPNQDRNPHKNGYSMSSSGLYGYASTSNTNQDTNPNANQDANRNANYHGDPYPNTQWYASSNRYASLPHLCLTVYDC
jgi:hypothetical protein